MIIQRGRPLARVVRVGRGYGEINYEDLSAFHCWQPGAWTQSVGPPGSGGHHHCHLDCRQRPGSLRQAILNANNGDTIVFDPILTTKKIALTSGELTINNSITITGLGATNFAITGTSTSRVLTVNSGATVTLAAITLSGGAATNGGGIANFGTLTLNNVTLTNNTALSGGAIYTSNGVLTVNNSLLAANAATDGGAIFVTQGTATLAGSTLASNTAANTGGGVAANTSRSSP